VELLAAEYVPVEQLVHALFEMAPVAER